MLPQEEWEWKVKLGILWEKKSGNFCSCESGGNSRKSGNSMEKWEKLWELLFWREWKENLGKVGKIWEFSGNAPGPFQPLFHPFLPKIPQLHRENLQECGHWTQLERWEFLEPGKPGSQTFPPENRDLPTSQEFWIPYFLLKIGIAQIPWNSRSPISRNSGSHIPGNSLFPSLENQDPKYSLGIPDLTFPRNSSPSFLGILQSQLHPFP